jgi:hypothetical protein
VPFDELSEWDKEADRRIGAAIKAHVDADWRLALDGLEATYE